MHSTGADAIEKFWAEVTSYENEKPLRRIARNPTNCLPSDANITRFATRVKGGGSLGGRDI